MGISIHLSPALHCSGQILLPSLPLVKVAWCPQGPLNEIAVDDLVNFSQCCDKNNPTRSNLREEDSFKEIQSAVTEKPGDVGGGLSGTNVCSQEAERCSARLPFTQSKTAAQGMVLHTFREDLLPTSM